jgi:hypothetical protein
LKRGWKIAAWEPDARRAVAVSSPGVRRLIAALSPGDRRVIAAGLRSCHCESSVFFEPFDLKKAVLFFADECVRSMFRAGFDDGHAA